MNSQHKYEREIVENVEESLSIISGKIEPNSVVLDIGCSSGMLGQYLAGSKGCIIDGIDIDHDSIRKCSPIYRKVVIKNLDQDEFVSCFIEQSYDYIVVADVAEHLYDISNLVSQLRLLIKPKGTIIFSVPNVSHIASALALLYGNFDYRASGLLDSTHIRFFSFDGLVRKLESCGLYPSEYDSVTKDISETEYGVAQSTRFPPEWIEAMVASRPDALVYQWIVSTKIYPSLDAHRSATRSARKTPLLTSALYWSTRAHPDFSEEKKSFAVAYKNENNDTVATMAFGASHAEKISKVRLDPISEVKIILIRDVFIKDRDGKVIWQWDRVSSDDELVNASWVGSDADNGCLLYSAGSDPQWYLKLNQDVLEQINGEASLELIFSDDRLSVDPCTIKSIRNDRENIRDLQSQAATLAERLSETRITAERLSADLAESERRVAAIRSSHSWRITRPMRAIGDVLRHLRSRSSR